MTLVPAAVTLGWEVCMGGVLEAEAWGKAPMPVLMWE